MSAVITDMAYRVELRTVSRPKRALPETTESPFPIVTNSYVFSTIVELRAPQPFTVRTW